MGTEDKKILLGVAPTRRDDMAYGLEEAQAHKRQIFDKLDALAIDFIDMEDCAPDGFLMTQDSVMRTIEKFRAAKVDALFFPHCNFGCESGVGQVAKALGVPVLLWGPRDEDGMGHGDAQIGLFATGKVLRRFRVPFTYIPTTFLDEPLLDRGLTAFVAVSGVVRAFARAKILQVGTRPETFSSVMCNEGELLERFGIQIHPVGVDDLTAMTKANLADRGEEVARIVDELTRRCQVQVSEEVLKKSAAMKLALEDLVQKYRATGIAIQCWYAMQRELGIWPCAAGALLNELYVPTVCETDIHGVITCLMTDAALGYRGHTAFVDWGFRHPSNPNGEFVTHCGIAPIPMFKEKPVIRTRPYAKDWGGHVSGLMRGEGEMTFVRFDGDEGNYSVLIGNAQPIEGPNSPKKCGARMWLEVPDLPYLERKLVYGPYIHHTALVEGDIAPIMLEAVKYLPGVKADFAFDEQQMRAQRFWTKEG